jgi:adenine-specific DNA-methyltransferase
MMLPRLFLARNLLKDDGVIFVSIDDNEQANLKLLMDEVFGEENFIVNFIWEKRTNRENRKMVSVRHDYVLCYCKNINQKDNVINMLPMSEEALERYKNSDDDPRGNWKSDPATAQSGHATKSQFYTLYAPNGKAHSLQSGRCWLYTKEVMDEAIKDGRIWFGKTGNGVPRIKTYLDSKERGLTPESILFASEASTTEISKTKLKKLFGGSAIFDTPKPFPLVQIMLKMVTSKECITLDFFSGSGTLAQAVLELNEKDGGNRKYICVQLPEECEENSEAYKEGYKTIADISQARIKKVIEKIQQERNGKLSLETQQHLGFRKYTLSSSNFKIWRGDMIENVDDLQKQVELFAIPQKDHAESYDMLWELLIKNGVSLQEKIQVIENSNGKIYHTEDRKLAFVLDSYTDQIQTEVIALKPKTVVVLDSLFTGNDTQKTNAQLQFEDNDILFKTV